MKANKRISQVYSNAREVTFDDRSKFVVMSDCHRGDGSYADNFARNQNLFFAALTQYYYHKYTYIELGDGDELWENDKISKPLEVYDHIFWLLSKFHQSGRLFMIYGNHDIVKGKNGSIKSQLALFPGICFYEGLLLRHTKLDLSLFLLHGHQADFLNDRLWIFNRFLVRYLWRPLELLGINDPTSAATNPKRKKAVERALIRWTEKEKQPLIAGHTHRAVFPKPGDSCYFNDGSCVHPRCITALEIADGNITLVKWSYKTKFDGTVFVGRDELADPLPLEKLCLNDA
ncbi:MAG TPA: serine/threonine protein phosphatase [Bacillota bacterium]|jgi:UDP-2,3-diacylglucosamine pyrophosphatase LpxH|nr:serine/threonine protein phosphatase [Bacillota bacterium]